MIPAFANEDRLPHDRAVWREHRLPTPGEIIARVPVSVMRGDFVEQTTADAVDWTGIGRWRYGWAPTV